MEKHTAANADAFGIDGAAVAEDALPQKKQKKPINQQKLQDNLWGWIFCLPLIVGTIWFVFICLVAALLLSFTDYSILRGSMFGYLAEMGDHIMHTSDGTADPFYWYKTIFDYNYDGMNTYIELAAPYKMNAMGAYLFNTVFYMIGIPIGMILSMFFAVCMTRDIPGANVFRVIYYFPCVASTVSIVYTFKLMFSPTGVINQLFGIDGTDGGNAFVWLQNSGNPPNTWNMLTEQEVDSAFMADPFWCQGIISKLVIIIMSVWKGLGGTIILYIAGLSGVNAATKEAAQIDGANGWQIFWKVTMPDLYPTIFYNIVTAVIGGMQIYMEPVLLLGESPLTSGYVSHIYRYGLQGGNPTPSRGAAYGMVLAVMIIIMTLFQFYLDSKNKD